METGDSGIGNNCIRRSNDRDNSRRWIHEFSLVGRVQLSWAHVSSVRQRARNRCPLSQLYERMSKLKATAWWTERVRSRKEQFLWCRENGYRKSGVSLTGAGMLAKVKGADHAVP